jgi:hypothetical protein
MRQSAVHSNFILCSFIFSNTFWIMYSCVLWKIWQYNVPLCTARKMFMGRNILFKHYIACVQLISMFSHHSSMYILQHVSTLSGHRQVIHFYIYLFTLLLFIPTLVSVLHMGEVVWYYCLIILYRLYSNYYYWVLYVIRTFSCIYQIIRITCVLKKVKLSVCLINWALCHEDIWGSGDIAPPFLTSALDGDEWSASRPGCYTPGEVAPNTHWIGGWVGPRAGLNAVEKRKSCYAGNEPRPSSL